MGRTRSIALAAHWRLFLFEGVILVILGILAIAVPAVATLAVDIYIGWLFLFAGIAGLFAVFSVQDISGFLLSLIPAALSLAVGGLLIWKPAEGALSLTALMVIFFAAEGLFQIVTSIAYRDYIPDSWGWILLSGIADLVLAGIIIYGWPVTATWALGVLAGVNLITSGGAIIMAALAGREVAGATGAPAPERPY
ncbi:MAG: HdeD family acid-resistance protein [Rhodomicrobium sp.]